MLSHAELNIRKADCYWSVGNITSCYLNFINAVDLFSLFHFVKYEREPAQTKTVTHAYVRASGPRLDSLSKVSRRSIYSSFPFDQNESM